MVVRRAGALVSSLAAVSAMACSTEVNLGGPHAMGAPSAMAPGGPVGDAAVPEPCVPGEYRGSFWSTRGLSLNGATLVTLTRSDSGDSFSVDRNSGLVGDQLPGEASFSAALVGGGSCISGEFSATIQNGEFRLPSTADGAPPPDPIPFIGTVTGRYHTTMDGSILTGLWQAYVLPMNTGEATSSGTWVADGPPRPQE